jgi:hypothetical protein
MKRIAFVSVILAAVAGIVYKTNPAEFDRYAGAVEKTGLRLWENVEANPVPVFIALGTFLLTVIYHKAKGKSLRESVEVAATRVTVVVPPKDSMEHPAEPPVVLRAKARATRAQLIADQIGLQNRHRKLPDEVLKAEKEACYTEQAVADTKRALGEKHKAHNVALAKLKALRGELAKSEAELAEIDAELKKLAELV